jgi:hypothetical protein
MNYSQEIGQTLAETLEELFVIDEMGIPLNEIRDLATLKGHLDSAAERYGVKHPKYKALQNLHAKKEAAEQRKAERMQRIKTRQEFHAKRYGYKPVKGSKRNEWVHESGHKLTFGDGRSWSHMKAGGKRAKGGNATPIRDLRRHLAKLHEDVDVEQQGEPLQEIRHLNVLGKLASQALLASDPQKRQELRRVLALKKRKWNLMPGMREDEERPAHWKDGETATHWATGHPKSASAQRQDAYVKGEKEKEVSRNAAIEKSRQELLKKGEESRKVADAKKAEHEKEKSNCQTCKRGGPGPEHDGSPLCRSGSIASGGKKAHCSCDTCY